MKKIKSLSFPDNLSLFRAKRIEQKTKNSMEFRVFQAFGPRGAVPPSISHPCLSVPHLWLIFLWKHQGGNELKAPGVTDPRGRLF
jgi:hypothetical protein